MATPLTEEALIAFDLATGTVRELNQLLHEARPDSPSMRVLISNPSGKHAVAVGLNAPYEVEVDGHVGYYCAGMNQLASVRVWIGKAPALESDLPSHQYW